MLTIIPRFVNNIRSGSINIKDIASQLIIEICKYEYETNSIRDISVSILDKLYKEIYQYQY